MVIKLHYVNENSYFVLLLHNKYLKIKIFFYQNFPGKEVKKAYDLN